MKRLILVFILLLASQYQSNSDVFEFPLSVKTYNADSTAFKFDNVVLYEFYDTLNGLAGCMNGIILKTSDGGDSWKKIELLKDRFQHNLTNIEYQDKNTVWAAEEKGGSKVYKSTDGGDSWQPKQLFEGDTARKGLVYFMNENYGWIVDDYHVVHRTTDGGKTWKHLNIEPKFGKPLQMQFANNLYGWMTTTKIMEDGSEVDFYTDFLRTTDGGKTWEKILVKKGYYGYYEQFQFIDQEHGYLRHKGHFYASWSSLYKTTDGGLNWNLLPITKDTVKRARYTKFKDIDNGFVMDEERNRYETSDGGESWTKSKPDTSIQMNRYYYINDHLGFGLEYDLRLTEAKNIGNRNITLNRTTNGGKSWQNRHYYKNERDYYRRTNNTLQRDMNGHIYCGFDYGTIVKIDEAHWENKLCTNGKSMIDYSMTNEDTCFVLLKNEDPKTNEEWDDRRTFESTFDGGKTWKRIEYFELNKDRFVFEDINFINDTCGFAYARDFYLEPEIQGFLITTDLGMNWKWVYSDKSIYEYASFRYFLDEYTYYFATDNWAYNHSTIYQKTNDGGMSWDTLDIIHTKNLHFFNSSHGRSFDSLIHETTDGGYTWATIGKCPHARSLVFYDDDNGILYEHAPAYNDRIFVTKNGGLKWDTLFVPNDFRILDLVMTSPNQAWAITEERNIIKINLDQIVSVDDNPGDYSNNFSVYPNPTSGLVSIETDFVKHPTVAIFDPSGRKYEYSNKLEFNSGLLSLDLSGFATGIYMIELRTGDRVEAVKVLKK
jgi:photosystem II stability/assembly factor-like uncharacterized protein